MMHDFDTPQGYGWITLIFDSTRWSGAQSPQSPQVHVGPATLREELEICSGRDCLLRQGGEG